MIAFTRFDEDFPPFKIQPSQIVGLTTQGVHPHWAVNVGPSNATVIMLANGQSVLVVEPIDDVESKLEEFAKYGK
jgi:hypothetical protein